LTLTRSWPLLGLLPRADRRNTPDIVENLISLRPA